MSGVEWRNEPIEVRVGVDHERHIVWVGIGEAEVGIPGLDAILLGSELIHHGTAVHRQQLADERGERNGGQK